MGMALVKYATYWLDQNRAGWRESGLASLNTQIPGGICQSVMQQVHDFTTQTLSRPTVKRYCVLPAAFNSSEFTNLIVGINGRKRPWRTPPFEVGFTKVICAAVLEFAKFNFRGEE